MLEVDETNVHISWNRPTQPGSPVLTGYKLCCNDSCDVDVKKESANVGVARFKQNKCYNITIYGVSKSGDEHVNGSHSEPVWIVTGNTYGTLLMFLLHSVRWRGRGQCLYSTCGTCMCICCIMYICWLLLSDQSFL